ncbi:hypothetical protein [Sphingomonas sp. BK345]|uniref:hypothetical protein n=2 Tax=unclassified Sphingomonas TaxID=196159 RepID=UPI00161D5DF2|nr:hypothetical protein [Sphingomonas sp. BK345]MBB3347382.1 hypothetical protein [Sphingomonas sp. BK069]MBB3472177.1 hypothetical protein [Sphingomonas sp. BK345]
MMLHPAAPPSDHEPALVPLVPGERADGRPRQCRAYAAVAAAASLLALWRGVALAAAILAAFAGACLYLARRLDRHRAHVLAERLAAISGTALTHRWCFAGPGAVAVAEGPLVWLIDRSTAYQTVQLDPEQIAGVLPRHGWRAWRVTLRYRLDPHEVARRSLICFGRDQAAAEAFVAHLTRR